MRILVGKTFGIGNAICCIPMLKALYSLGHTVDVLVGTGPDDIGALAVLEGVQKIGVIGTIHKNIALSKMVYDLAIMSIPFDGRWQNGIHYHANEVLDGRTRPDPSTTGFVSWKKHEIEYQIDTARELGYALSHIPKCSFFLPNADMFWKNAYYLGVGYKKDTAGFWVQKHWGNENYIALVNLILENDPDSRVFTTGDEADVKTNIIPIMQAVKSPRFKYVSGDLPKSFDVVRSCEFYVGNDTGMMHVAAAFDRKVLGMFFMENAMTKSRPWCDDYIAVDGVTDRTSVTPEYIFTLLQEMKDED